MSHLKTIGVVGAGVMGVGVAQNLAQTDHEVILIDIADDILEKARETIYNNVRFQGFFNKENVQNPEAVLAKIHFTQDYQALQAADFVVENVVEKWDVKKAVYALMDPICPEHCVFAVNTSVISITRVGSVTQRADRVIGMHFMNPVPMKNTVEVIRGHHTTEETIATAQTFLSQMGKTCVVVNDMPGFVSNRVLMLTINEAAYLLQDQVATAQAVDKIFRECFGHKMGPLETADLIGLDTILYSIEGLYEGYNDSKYRPCPLLRKMVDAGLYGMKNGQGFYSYQQNKKK